MSISPAQANARKKGIVKAIGGAMRVARIHSPICHAPEKRQRASAYAAGTPNSSEKTVEKPLASRLCTNEPGNWPVQSEV